MSKIKTTEIKTGAGGTPKALQPGNNLCKINSVELEAFKFRPGGYHIILSLESKPIGGDFDGFLIDKDNPSVGKYLGQVGQVKASEWAFSDGETKTGTQISRDTEILRFLKNLCTALGIPKWLDEQNDKHDTIESLITAFNSEKPFKDIYLKVCLAGKEYTNKGGYPAYELFFPKFSKTGAPFEAEKVTTSKLLKFNEADHIRKKKVESVEDFTPESGTDVSSSVKDDFKL